MAVIVSSVPIETSRSGHCSGVGGDGFGGVLCRILPPGSGQGQGDTHCARIHPRMKNHTLIFAVGIPVSRLARNIIVVGVEYKGDQSWEITFVLITLTSLPNTTKLPSTHPSSRIAPGSRPSRLTGLPPTLS